MITFKTLENTPTEELTATFNLSFSDYVVPFSLSKEQLEDRIHSDNIRLELSAGAFRENQLIGFILHGYDVVETAKVAYNAGTGVIPSQRGNHLTAKMYEFILPSLQEEKIEFIQLEVIATNAPAIITYSQLGFEIIRSLVCFKGSILAQEEPTKYEIRELEDYDWLLLKSFWDFSPSWQNSITAVEKLKQHNVSIGVFQDDKLLGYLIYNPKTKRVQQFGVDKARRRIGVGQKLFNYLKDNYQQQIGIINIDESSEETFAFMHAIGLHCFITQYEMQMKLMAQDGDRELVQLK